jgi:hypothetical protein
MARRARPEMGGWGEDENGLRKRREEEEEEEEE